MYYIHVTDHIMCFTTAITLFVQKFGDGIIMRFGDDVLLFTGIRTVINRVLVIARRH